MALFPAQATPTTFLSGITNPQHLLPASDGAPLVSDYRTGTIYRIAPLDE